MATAFHIPIQLVDAFGAGVFALTLATHADLWWHRRDRPSHFWLAASALGALMVNLTGAAIRAAPAQHPGHAIPIIALNMLGVAIALVSLYELAESIGGKRPGRIARAMQCAALLPIVLVLVTSNEAWMPVLFLTSALFLLAAMLRAIRHARLGDRESRVLAFGLMPLFAALLHDMLSELGLLPRVNGLPVLGFTVLYIAAARALSLRYDREHRELQALRGELETRVQQRTSELEQANRRLNLLSRTDALTGLANRRSFFESASLHMARHDAALLMIDIDHFKHVNDVHGHDAGDAALRAVADALHRGLREGDLLARWGGEEFIALVDAGEALACAERLRHAVAAGVVGVGGTQLRLTVSIGLSHAVAGTALAAAMSSADRALYHAKQSGRDRVVVANSQPA